MPWTTSGASSSRICWLLDGLSVSIVIGEDAITVPEAIDHAVALLPPELAGSF